MSNADVPPSRLATLQDIIVGGVREGRGHAFALPDEWMQGRTAYGGLSSALAFDVARHVESGLPPLRSAQIAFVGPMAGRLSVEATVLRRGRSSAFVEARVSGQDGLGLTATFLFMAERASAIALPAPSAPDVPPPGDAAPAMRRSGPTFARMLDYRHALPQDQGREPRLRRWVRLRERDGIDPVTELLLVGDALPPGVVPLMTEPMPISSANWTIHLLCDEPRTEDGWWLLESTGIQAGAGASVQSMAIWNSRGEPVALGSQTVAIFG